MTDEQQFNAFKKITKGEIILNNDIQLVLRNRLYDKPEKEMSYGKDAIFDVHVTNDSTYTEEGIDYAIWDILDTFEKLIGENVQFDFKFYFGGQPKNNIGEPFKEKVDNILKNITNIHMGDITRITMFVDHVETGFSIEQGGESRFKRFVITNYVKAIKAFEDGKEVSVDDGVSTYEWFLDKRPYDDSDNNYLVIDHLMDEYKGLSSEDMIIYVTTEFV